MLVHRSVGKTQTENELNQTHQQNELIYKLICYRLPINQTVNQGLRLSYNAKKTVSQQKITVHCSTKIFLSLQLQSHSVT